MELTDRQADPSRFILHSRQAIFGGLIDGVMRGETFLALIGPPGIGKTTMAYAIHEELVSRSVRVLQVSRRDSTGISLRTMASQILGVSEAELDDDVVVERLYHALTVREDLDQGFVLIVDDAEILRADALAYLRLLTIVAAESMPQVVFVGRPEFWDAESVRQPDLKELITARWELAPLSAEETREFIAQSDVAPPHGMEAAFTTDGLAALVRHSNGSCGRVAALLSLARTIRDERHEPSLTLTVIDAAAAKLDGGEVAPPAAWLPQSENAQIAPEPSLALPDLPPEPATLPEPRVDVAVVGRQPAEQRRQRTWRFVRVGGMAAILSIIAAAACWQVVIHVQRMAARAASIGDQSTVHAAVVAAETKPAPGPVMTPDTAAGPAGDPCVGRSGCGRGDRAGNVSAARRVRWDCVSTIRPDSARDGSGDNDPRVTRACTRAGIGRRCRCE